MMKDKLSNDNLEHIGGSLFKAARPAAEEVEMIVNRPHLLASVKARIKIDQQAAVQKNPSFVKRSNFRLWNWQTAIGVLSLVTLVFSFIIFQKEEAPQIAERIMPTDIQSSAFKPRGSQNIEEKVLTNSGLKRKTYSGKTAFKPKISKERGQIRKTEVLKSEKSTPKTGSEIFYSLTTGRNLENSGEDLRVVHTELSKSDLLALGINLPLENEDVKLKTILLIGEDGMARAFRFVGSF